MILVMFEMTMQITRKERYMPVTYAPRQVCGRLF